MRVQLSDAAEDAIRTLAIRERRDPRRQIEAMVEAELKRRGLLVDEPRQPKSGVSA